MVESDLQRKIQKALRRMGCWVCKNHGNIYSVPGLPDLTVIHLKFGVLQMTAEQYLKNEIDGDCVSPITRTIWLEVKMPGKKLSKVQRACHRQMQKHGAEVFTVTSVKEAEEVVLGQPA